MGNAPQTVDITEFLYTIWIWNLLMLNKGGVALLCLARNDFELRHRIGVFVEATMRGVLTHKASTKLRGALFT